MSGPEYVAAASSVTAPQETAPPGHFLTAELESDCARFLAEVRELARRRAQAAAEPTRV